MCRLLQCSSHWSAENGVGARRDGGGEGPTGPLRGPGAAAPAGSRQQAAGRSPWGLCAAPFGGLLFTSLRLSLIVKVVMSEWVGRN